MHLGVIKEKLQKNIGYYLLLSLVYFFFINLNLTDNYSYVTIHFDETVIFNQILHSYESESFSQLFFNLFHQNDFQYGRITTYLSAIIFFPIHHFFGDVALFVFNRLFFMSLQFFAFVILIDHFIKNQNKKVIAILFLATLDSTLYYAHTPKPEPYLLLFIACYFRFYHLKGSLGFFLWGLCVGTKISTIPAFLAVGFKFLHRNHTRIFSIFFLFLMGYFLANPALTIPSLDIWQAYINDTFLNTGFITDNPNINVIDWVREYFKQYFGFNTFFLFALFIVFLPSLIKKMNRNIFLNLDEQKKELLIISLCFIIPIILFVNRVWLFYIHIGVCLLTIFFLSLNFELTKRKKTAAFLFTFLLIASEAVKSFHFSNDLKNKDQLPLEKQKIALWREVSTFLNKAMKPNQTVCTYHKFPFDYRDLKAKIYYVFTPTTLNAHKCDYFIISKLSLNLNYNEFPLLKESIKSFKDDLKQLTGPNCVENCIKKVQFNEESLALIYKKIEQ